MKQLGAVEKGYPLSLQDLYPLDIVEETEQTWPGRGEHEARAVLSPEEMMLRREQFTSLVDWVLEPLEPVEKQALRMWFLENMPRTTVAHLLQCKVSEVWQRIDKILTKAREMRTLRS